VFVSLRQTAADDVLAAVSDLHASQVQARLVSTHAFAWRAALVTVPVTLLTDLVLLAAGKLDWGAAAGLMLAAFLVPQVIAVIVSALVGFLPDLLSLFRGTHEQRVRFAFGGSNAYLYYGWRYAFRGRRRPWGALTHDEKLLQNPRRMGVVPGSE
jgi:hypothetical protein